MCMFKEYLYAYEKIPKSHDELTPFSSISSIYFILSGEVR